MVEDFAWYGVIQVVLFSRYISDGQNDLAVICMHCAGLPYDPTQPMPVMVLDKKQRLKAFYMSGAKWQAVKENLEDCFGTGYLQRPCSCRLISWESQATMRPGIYYWRSQGDFTGTAVQTRRQSADLSDSAFLAMSDSRVYQCDNFP